MRAQVRPSRWAWKLGGLEMSRLDLVRCWQLMKAPREDLPPGRVWFVDGVGCVTDERQAGKRGREVLTLRDLLQVARRDYIDPRTRREIVKEEKP